MDAADYVIAPLIEPRVEEGSKDRTMVLRILAYPNMLEALASMYNDGLVDRRIVKRQVETDARSFWGAAGWWIQQIRSEFGSSTFKEIEVMINDFDT